MPQTRRLVGGVAGLLAGKWKRPFPDRGNGHKVAEASTTWSGEVKVRIGEEGNLVRLTKEAWNTLVEKIAAGELTKLR